MSYSEHVAKVAADQLERFVTLNRHQLAGQTANLDFWVAEARHALEVIDGYQERFLRLKAGQADYVKAHHTVVANQPDDFDIPLDPPRRVPDASLRDARRSVTDALYRFLIRLFHDGHIPETRMRSICKDLDIGIDVADVRRKGT